MSLTQNEIVKQKLEEFPDFRERRFRHKGLVRLALRECGIERKYTDGIQLTVNEMSDFAISYDSYRHAWTDCLRDYPELRGSDYKSKEALVQQHQMNLGYQPNHYQTKKEVLNK